jgi:hypothetical protein
MCMCSFPEDSQAIHQHHHPLQHLHLQHTYSTTSVYALPTVVKHQHINTSIQLKILQSPVLTHHGHDSILPRRRFVDIAGSESSRGLSAARTSSIHRTVTAATSAAAAAASAAAAAVHTNIAVGHHPGKQRRDCCCCCSSRNNRSGSFVSSETGRQ